MKFLAGSDPKVTEWLRRIGVPHVNNVARVVIDVSMDSCVRFYVERLADERLIVAGLPEGGLRAEIVEAGKGQPKQDGHAGPPLQKEKA